MEKTSPPRSPAALSDTPLALQAVQLIFPSFQFGKDDPAVAERLVELGVGGFCLYRGTPREIADFVARLQSLARIPLLFAADYEDGTASHVEGGTPLPANMAVGASGLEALAYQKGLITAVEARAMGVRWVFAPVLDLATVPGNPIVNVRAFGVQPALAAKMGRAYMQGLRSQGVLSCAKHFPGHGETVKDSHLELPTVKVPRARLMTRELKPFAATAPSADSVMLGHLHVPAFGDARGLPIPLSEKAVDGVLRRKLAFRGLIVTDALDMRALAERYTDFESSLLALRAGADILLVPKDPAGLAARLPEAVAKDPAIAERVRAAFDRLARAKESSGILKDGGLPVEEDLCLVGSARHFREAQQMAAATLAWVKRGREEVRLPPKLLYLEPAEPSPEAWRGKLFIDELRALGFEVSPYAPGKEGSVLAASFLSPRAYSGRIRFDAAQLKLVRGALKSGRPSVLISFGSPYVFDDAPGFDLGLCAFSGGAPTQKAAAQVLAGRAPAPGRMPVPLACMAKGKRRR